MGMCLAILHTVVVLLANIRKGSTLMRSFLPLIINNSVMKSHKPRKLSELNDLQVAWPMMILPTTRRLFLLLNTHNLLNIITLAHVKATKTMVILAGSMEGSLTVSRDDTFVLCIYHFWFCLRTL